MMCNYNGLACQEYLRGVTSSTEVRSEGVRFARDSLLEVAVTSELVSETTVERNGFAVGGGGIA
jgi:hypothetical protein